jgi:hypothetical protein
LIERLAPQPSPNHPRRLQPNDEGGKDRENHRPPEYATFGHGISQPISLRQKPKLLLHLSLNLAVLRDAPQRHGCEPAVLFFLLKLEKN